MRYQTPADIVEREQERRRALMRWALPAFGLGLLALGLGFLAAALGNRPLQWIAFGIGVCGVALGFVGVLWIMWGMVMSVLGREVAPRPPPNPQMQRTSARRMEGR
jgi:hypothetical protein